VESTKKLANVLVSQEDKRGALKVVTRLAKFLGSDIDLEVASMVVNLLRETRWETRTPEQNELYSNSLACLVQASLTNKNY
jgi:hypothetical protein